MNEDWIDCTCIYTHNICIWVSTWWLPYTHIRSTYVFMFNKSLILTWGNTQHIQDIRQIIYLTLTMLHVHVNYSFIKKNIWILVCFETCVWTFKQFAHDRIANSLCYEASFCRNETGPKQKLITKLCKLDNASNVNDFAPWAIWMLSRWVD